MGTRDARGMMQVGAYAGYAVTGHSRGCMRFACLVHKRGNDGMHGAA